MKCVQRLVIEILSAAARRCDRLLATHFGALLLWAGIVFFAYAFLHPSYNTNDDVTLRLILEGRMVPNASPSGEVYFINFELGRLLAWLYKLAPHFYWYDIAELVVIGFAFLVGVRLIVLTGGERSTAHVIFFAAAILAVVAQPQFTIVAILATGIGILSIALPAMGLLGPVGVVERYVLAVAGGGLSLAGLLFRLRGGVIALIFTGFCILVLTAMVRRPRLSGGGQLALLLAAPSALFVVAALALTSHANFIRNQPGWSEFSIFNSLRSSNTELLLPRRQTSPLTNAAVPGGLSVHDREALLAYVYFDPNVITVTRLSHERSDGWTSRLADVDWISIARQFLKCLIFLLPIGIAISGVVLGTRQRDFLYAALLCCIWLLVVIFVLLIALKAPPWRILWPMGVLDFVVLVCFCPAGPSNEVVGKAIPRTLLVISSLLTLSISVFVSFSNEIDTRRANLDVLQSDLRSAPTIFSFQNLIRTELLERPFQTGPIQRELRVIQMGIMIRSPIVAQQLSHWSAVPLAGQICGKANNVIIARADSIAALRNYYFDHQSLSVRFDRNYVGKVFDVYACRRISANYHG